MFGLCLRLAPRLSRGSSFVRPVVTPSISFTFNNMAGSSGSKIQSCYILDPVRHYVRRLKRKTACGLNTHRSNRAKEGLYHGKDVRSGNSISFSHTKHKRKFYPNVQNKRVWSETLDSWVRFKMTTTAMKAIDRDGGIDNYILSLDEPSVADSRYITKMRAIIATSRFHKGLLDERMVRRLGYDKETPPPSQPIKVSDDNTTTPLDTKKVGVRKPIRLIRYKMPGGVKNPKPGFF